jgi:hypothetical protein
MKLKMLEENIGESFMTLALPMFTLYMTTKTKIDKWDHMKIKIFCTAEETMSGVKRKAEYLTKG